MATLFTARQHSLLRKALY